MRRTRLIALAISLAVLALAFMGYRWIEQPTVLRVAVGPAGSEDARLIAAAAQYLARERASIRFKLVPTEGVAHSAKSLTDDLADLAVVRTDVAMPEKGQAMAIMHRDAALLIAPERAGIAKVADLKGKTVGIIRKLPANAELLQTVLAQYQIPVDSVAVRTFDGPEQAAAAVKSRDIDVVLVVGTVSGRTVTETVAALSQIEGPAPVFISVSEADAIAQRSPAYESMEVLRGAFGGSPPRPAETLRTLGVSHRLVASTALEDSTVSEATKQLFTMRPTISAQVPIANRIEGPDTSKSSYLPVHPGAAAYYDGEVQTFFERYSDWIYLGIMGLSIAGSAMAGIASTASARNRTRTLGLLDRLLGIVRLARAAESDAELHALEHEADEILAVALAKAGTGGLDDAGISAFTLGLDQARQAISERRRHLGVAPIPTSQAAE
jgi:TRAP transporter TAXI family solute receptor